jgi:hypothetical protein
MREQGPIPSHNLFRRKDTADLYCAVPESRPIPPFIRTPAWEFAGKMDRSLPVPGFPRESGAPVMQLWGFYAFNSIN